MFLLRKTGCFRIGLIPKDRKISVFSDTLRKTEKYRFFGYPPKLYYYLIMEKGFGVPFSNPQIITAPIGAEKVSHNMELKEKKSCPFNTKPCMEKKCALLDSEIWQCEFKNLTCFIGECFNEISEKMEKWGGCTDD